MAALDETLRRAAALDDGVVAIDLVRRAAPGDGYERAATLHEPGPLLDHHVAASADGGGTDLRHIGAQWWFERCAWLAASVLMGCALTSRRLPGLSPGDVFVGARDGIPFGMGFARDTVIVLEGDPAAGEPGVRVVGDERALAAAAREELERHLAPLADALTDQGLRRPRPLWRSAGDRVAQAALWAGEAAGRQDDAERFAVDLLASPSPMHVPWRTAPAATGGVEHLRSSCCLAHRTPSGVICDGCPRAHLLDHGRRRAGGEGLPGAPVAPARAAG